MIRVNDRDEVGWQTDLTVADLLDRLRYSFPHIIVSVDGVVVDREDYETRTIPDGADVHVIHLIAGG